MTIVPPNLSLRESGSIPRPILYSVKEHAPAWHSTYQQLIKEPRLDGHDVLVLQGQPPAPDKVEDGVRPKPFLFFSFLFSSFYHKLQPEPSPLKL
jgi:hypothetical protein